MTLIIDFDKLADAIADRVLQRLQAHQPAPTTMLTRTQVAARIGKSPSTAKRLQASPGFPRPVRVGNGRPRWRAAEVDQWIERHGGGR